MPTTQTQTNGSDREWLSCAETATHLRKALTQHFPGTKFSVRSNTYSMGASINVKWTDGPTTDEVERVAKFFAGATFDGMTDSMNYHATEFNGRAVRFGADFVFCNREHSATLQARAYRSYCQKFGLELQSDWREDNRRVGNYAVCQEVGRLMSHMRPNGCIVTMKVGA